MPDVHLRSRSTIMDEIVKMIIQEMVMTTDSHTVWYCSDQPRDMIDRVASMAYVCGNEYPMYRNHVGTASNGHTNPVN